MNTFDSISLVRWGLGHVAWSLAFGVGISAALLSSTATAQSGSRGSARSAPASPAISSPRVIQSPQASAVPSPMSSVVPVPVSDPSISDPVVASGNSASDDRSPAPSSSGLVPAAAISNDIWTIHDPNSDIGVDHSSWDYFLSRYVITDANCLTRVDYGRVSGADRHGLNNYLCRLQSVDVRTLNRDEQLSYWLNLYNARVVSLILDHYPLRSVRAIKSNVLDLLGPFDDEVLCVLGQRLTLNDVESGIVRPIWNDPRTHYALNCASYGCPNLSRQAWSPVDLDARLNSAAFKFLNSDRAVRRGLLGGVRLSNIFKWYKDDFGGTDQAVLSHIRRYANVQTSKKLGQAKTITGYFYDWSLNDAATQRGPLTERLLR